MTTLTDKTPRYRRMTVSLLALLLLVGGVGVATAESSDETSRSTLRMGFQPVEEVTGVKSLGGPGSIDVMKVIEGELSEELRNAKPLGKAAEARARALASGIGEVEVETAKVDDLYRKWAVYYAKQGGDRNVQLGLGPIRGLMPVTELRGKAQLDLIDAKVRVELENLLGPVDLWLVDNQSGPGKSVIPERGDRFFKLGRVVPRGELEEFETVLDAGFFDDFELDLVVATKAGVHPEDAMLLIGVPSSFQRQFTRERLGRTVERVPAKSTDPRVALGLVSQDVLDGGDLFFRGIFDGNGRSCGTCHPPESNLVIDPDFIAQLRRNRPNDPLFIADPGRPDFVPLEIPDLLERFGLIFENVDGFEDPANKFMMRSVPHNISSGTALLPPGDSDGDGILDDGTVDTVFAFRTGWSGDGAPSPGSMRIFPVGAVIQHYTRDFDIRVPTPQSFRLQTDAELNKMEKFLLSAGRLNELDLATVSLTDAGAERGRVLFTTGAGGGKCFGCHNNAGGNSAFGGNRNFNTGVETVRIAELNSRGIPCDGGFGGQGNVPPNNVGCAPGSSGGRGDGSFNTIPLVESADTGPFFHTNAFETIEDAVAFYSSAAFNDSPAGALISNAFGEPINLNAQQNDDVGAFLRVVNASFNLNQTLQRIQAAQRIGGAFGLSQRNLTNNLLILANNELVDAFFVLDDKRLNLSSRRDLVEANRSIIRVLQSFNASTRAFHAERARAFTARAERDLGSQLLFDMGEGNLVF